MPGPAQIVVENVSHMYRPPRGREVLALDQISLEVANREFVALLGPSGCGKSTLLYLIGGFLPVEKGTIRVDGAVVTGPGPDRWGGDRHGANLFGNSLVAVDANTGKRLWHFQLLHHEVWDWDFPTPPMPATARIAAAPPPVRLRLARSRARNASRPLNSEPSVG